MTYEEIQALIKNNISERTFDINDQVPHFWKNCAEMIAITDSDNTVYKIAHKEYYKWFLNQWVYSADSDGLAIWENALNLSVDIDNSLKDRRLAILNNLGTTGTNFTYWWLDDSLNNLIEKYEIDTSEYTNYKLKITFGNIPFSIFTFTKKLRRTIPCNIILDCKVDLQPVPGYYYGMCVKVKYGTKTIVSRDLS